MMSLIFHRADEKGNTTIGPHEQFSLVGPYLRADGEFEIVARVVNRYWQSNGAKFLSCECQSPVSVRFRNSDGAASEDFGPFNSLCIVNGQVYGDEEPIAQLIHRAELWRCLRNDTYWRAMVLEPAFDIASQKPR